MSDPLNLSLARFWSPSYWPTWLLLLCLRAIAVLPFSWRIALGKRLGPLLQRIKKREHRVAQRNLEVCFTQLSEQERDSMLQRHFEAVGLSFVEMATAWFSPTDHLRKIIHVAGREHLDRALAVGKGVILLTAHFTTLEIGVSILGELCPQVSCLYRPQRNPMIDVMIRRGRSRFSDHHIPRDDVRALLRGLRQNRAVLYLPDQTHLGNQSELLPFFGEPAVTNVATSKLAKISGATLLPYFFRRLPDNSGYVVNIGAPLNGFPTDDVSHDTKRLFKLIEDYILLAPEQYLWLYKKFKGRPAPYPDLYR